MNEYPVGFVGMATVRGVKDVRVMQVDGVWLSVERAKGTWWHNDADVTDVRPLAVIDPQDSPAEMGRALSEAADRTLVVLDLYNPATVEDVSRVLRDGGYGNLVVQIEEQTRPPRIPEPGKWGVVEASTEGGPRRVFGHAPEHDEEHWVDDHVSWFSWDDLIDPVLVREGIEGGESR